MRDAPALEQLRELLGLGHRGRAHEHGLAGLVALDDVVDDRRKLGVLGLVDEVGLVGADHGDVGGDGDHRDVVGGGELGRLGLGRPRHARQLLVEPEVVLERDRGPGVVLLFDPHPLLGLDRLVEAVGPPPPFEGAAGELVDDLHLAPRDEVVLVPVVELLGPQGLGEVVHVVDRHQVVHVVHADLALHLGHARLGRVGDALLLVDLVVLVALEGAGQAGELVVELGRLRRRPRDDERRAGFVDEDRVDLVDDGVHVAALDHVLA